MQSRKHSDKYSSWKVFLLGLAVGILASNILGMTRTGFQMKVTQYQLETDKRPYESTRRVNPTLADIKAKLGKLSFLGNRDGSWKMFKSTLSDRSKPPIVYGFGVGKEISWDLSVIEACDCEMWAFDNTPVAIDYIRKLHEENGKTDSKGNVIVKAPPTSWHLMPFLIGTENGNVTLELPPGHTISFGPPLDKETRDKLEMELDETKRGRRKKTILRPARTLQSLMRSLGHTRLDVLKIDIEGAEFPIIADWARRKWSPPVCQLLVEFHQRLESSSSGGEGVYQQVLADLHSLGFTMVFSVPEKDHTFVNLNNC